MSYPNADFQAPPPLPEVKPAPRPTKLRTIAIPLFVIGLIVCALGIPKIIPGGIASGAALAFLGIVFFALSFVPLPVIENAEEPMSPTQKLLGVFFEPSRVFRNLRAHPRWVAAYLVVTVLSLVYTFAFTQRLTPERIVNYRVDKAAELPPPFTPPPDRIETLRTQGIEQLKNPIQRIGTVATTFVAVFCFTALLAALYLLGVLVFGGRINFWQSLAIMFYGAVPIIAIQKLLGLVLLYLKSPDDIHPILGQETLIQDNLGVLFTPADHPVIFVLATSIGILSFYSLWLKSTGLRNGGTRVSSGTAWGVAITLWILGTLAITGLTALFPSFIS
jgi:Yip1 domain